MTSARFEARGRNRAVMENTGGLDLGDEGAETAMYRRNSYFPTPPWAARAGAKVIDLLAPDPIFELSDLSCWEPAAGRGHMAHGLRDHFGDVMCSDIQDYGCGFDVKDFLSSRGPEIAPSWIITNPPFPLAADFVRHGLEIATNGVAILARLALLESVGRHDLMNDLGVLAPFSERVPMQMGSWNPELSTATAYAWFIWGRYSKGAGRLHMIPPGTKTRLTRESDEAFADGRPGRFEARG